MVNSIVVHRRLLNERLSNGASFPTKILPPLFTDADDICVFGGRPEALFS